MLQASHQWTWPPFGHSYQSRAISLIDALFDLCHALPDSVIITVLRGRASESQVGVRERKLEASGGAKYHHSKA